ncbi:aminotransferase class V-fold PLP-dependent enzyme [Granulicella sp. 5B5]|uniref:trans-sulfuration enzyme family protein n=1 Tax=Granulicella sp. 5B5 TaxID=1617967 RepID=UPI0015F45B24|nr:PLP-dependent aspartate aminotransferase family protein [Granulicella sp. 5B5]QMV17875.1 aminotransferase class V-fold PLP-dependent enzyme [Granulicella sp. 5B5]
MKFATKLVHFDAAPKDPYHPKVTPIYQTATFEQESADSLGEYDYSRSGNPTRTVLEEQMAALEGGAHGFCFASGMAAITCVTRLLSTGDEIVSDYDLYGGTARLFAKVLPRAGVTIRYVDASDVSAVAGAITAKTKMIYIESPTNPFLRVVDIAAIGAVAKQCGVLFAIDNSVMSPYLQNPLELGANMVIHSATKFLCGHSDVTGGVVVLKDDALAQRVHFLQNAEGTALAPFDSYLLLRGLKTLKLRMDAQQRSAQTIAEFLASHARVREVYYPGLASHRDHAVHMRQARGGGSVLSFTAGSAEVAKAIAERLELFSISLSFGSVQSSISVPVKMSHASVTEEMTSVRKPPADMLRLSIGIEDVDDLIADLRACLDSV